MIIDATTADRSVFSTPFDVCVIGSGPAGMTIARRLAAAGAKVAMMEAGGMEVTEESQSLYEGDVIGLDYFPLDVPRLRFMGGSSNHWAGWSRALDYYDFDHKTYAPYSGWPISRVQLDPYREEADKILDIPSESEAPDLAMKQTGYAFRRFQFRWSPPTRFAEKYLDELTQSENILLVLNANLVDLRLDDAHDTVTSGIFKSYTANDPGFSVQAKFFALCTGGIENARLLLNFDSQMPGGLGNQNDMVGRCFCEHPHFTLADAVLEQPVPEMEFYCPTQEFMLEQEILNFGLRLQPNTPPPPLVLTEAVTRSLVCGRDFTERLAERVLGSAPDCKLGGIDAYYKEFGVEVPMTGVIRIAFEQAQNPQSRVLIGTERDALGMRRTELDWHLSDIDVRTMQTAVLTFAKHMADQSLGRAKIRDWLLADEVVIPDTTKDEVGGKHHMCATRMSADPRHGVVDADCRVHGLSNLYIGGSSTFASTGQCNPTYTIVQLALRLGDHLTRRLA